MSRRCYVIRIAEGPGQGKVRNEEVNLTVYTEIYSQRATLTDTEK